MQVSVQVNADVSCVFWDVIMDVILRVPNMDVMDVTYGC